MKKVAVVVLVLALLIVGTQFVAAVGAIKPEVTYYSTYHFTHIYGSLDGADYEIFIPDSWNGHLVIGVRGYSHLEPEITSTHMCHVVGMTFMMSSDSLKFAYAWSTYGEGGWCIQAGIIRTHQLTQYVVENYDVPGKVLLIGFSMGGQIACMLADKYPDQYDGVLDVCGTKDAASDYDYWSDLSLLPPNPDQIRNYLNGPPAYLPASFTATMKDKLLLGMRNNAPASMSDIAMEYGGPPATKLKAYDRTSPTCHADITIPVISMIAQFDFFVPLQQFDMYYHAVEEASCLDYYRSYTIANGQHCDFTMIANVPTYFANLMTWVESGEAPPATPDPLP